MVEFDNVPTTNWVFFSSPNCVDFFFKKASFNPNTKYACLSSGTASKLAEYNISPSFIGDNTNTTQIAQAFGKVLDNSTVLFPVSAQSLKTIQQALPKAQVTNLVVYKTLLNKVNTPTNIGAVFFTSPLNVESFFNQNPNYKGTCFAIGNTTLSALKKLGKQAKMPVSFNQEDWAKLVISNC